MRSMVEGSPFVPSWQCSSRFAGEDQGGHDVSGYCNA